MNLGIFLWFRYWEYSSLTPSHRPIWLHFLLVKWLFPISLWVYQCLIILCNTRNPDKYFLFILCILYARLTFLCVSANLSISSKNFTTISKPQRYILQSTRRSLTWKSWLYKGSIYGYTLHLFLWYSPVLVHIYPDLSGTLIKSLNCVIRKLGSTKCIYTNPL